MYLQLAEAPFNYVPYVWIPDKENGGGFWMREDKLDTLNDNDFDNLMDDIAPYEADVMGLSEDSLQYLSGKAERQARREQRKDNKQAKTEAKTAKKAAKADNKQSKADARRNRSEAKVIKAQAKENMTPEERAARTGIVKDSINTVGGIVGNIFGKGGDAAGADTGGDSEKGPHNENDTIMGMPKTVVYVGGAVLVSVAAYMLLAPKKKAS